MIKQNTVLILGAGASRAYGFPLGAKFKAMIWNHFEENILDQEVMRNYLPLIQLMCNNRVYITDQTINSFNKALLLSPDYSIDSFLEHQSDEFKAIGKVGIAACLFPLEKRTCLYDDWMKIQLEKDYKTEIIFDDGHWYQYLFNKMSEGCNFEGFKDNNLSVITFNYDRSLEYYLLYSLKAKYGKAIKECAQVLKEFDIIHVYGSLGQLPELTIEQSDAVPYNTVQYDQVHHRNAANSLRIIPEERGTTSNSNHLLDVPKILRESSRIYFLGFGFLEDNMDKIFSEPGKEKYNLLKEVGNKCFGTAMGLSPHLKKKLFTMGIDKIKFDMSNQLRNHPDPDNFPNCNINEFLLHHPYSKLD